MAGPDPATGGAAALDPVVAPARAESVAESGDAAEVPMLEPTPVDDIAELPGDYYRPFALPGQFSYLSLGPLTQGDGAYELYRSCGLPTCVPEQGDYHAVGLNPAIGFAHLLLSTGGLVDSYVLDYLWRDASGELVAVQMRRLLAGGVTGPSFVMFRLPDVGDAVPSLHPAEVVELDPASLPPVALEESSGLASVYVRALPPPGEIGALTLSEPVWQDEVAAGNYQVARPYCLPWCLPEVGQYELEIVNAVTGSGWLTLRPASDPAAAVSYVVDGIWRNPVGGIVALQLQRVYAGGFVGAPFFMYRQWWDAQDLDPALPAAPMAPAVGSGLCAYYRGLEEYYAIRALQCAYSVCYPMSGYYGWWANYYHDLAEAACPAE